MLILELVTNFKEFVEFPFRIYKSNDFWVPQIISEERKSMNAKINPFIDKNEIMFFVAKKDGRVVGRISLGFGEFFGIESKVAFFGHFEVVNDLEVFRYMFNRITGIVKARNISTLIGPVNFSTNYSCGLLMDGFDRQPSILMPYNLQYYGDFFSQSGFTKLVDLYAFELNVDLHIPDSFEKFKNLLSEKFVVKNVTYGYLISNANKVTELFNQTWAWNLLFQKLDKKETLFLVEGFKHILNPSISFAVEYNNELVAFSVSLPDYSDILKYLDGKLSIFKLFGLSSRVKKIDRLRTAILGVLPNFRRQGIDILMIMKTIEEGKKNGFKKGEVSWILETNKLLLNTITKLHPIAKTVYRIYKITF